MGVLEETNQEEKAQKTPIIARGKRFNIPRLEEGALMEVDGRSEQIFGVSFFNVIYKTEYGEPAVYVFTGLRSESPDVIASTEYTLTRVLPAMLIWQKPIKHRRGQSNRYEEYDNALSSRGARIVK